MTQTNSTQFNPYQFRFTWHSKGRKHFAPAKSTLAFRVPLSKSPVLRMKPWPNSIRIHHSQFKAQFTLDFRMPLLRSPVHRTKHWPNSIQFPNSKINYPNTKSGQKLDQSELPQVLYQNPTQTSQIRTSQISSSQQPKTRPWCEATQSTPKDSKICNQSNLIKPASLDKALIWNCPPCPIPFASNQFTPNQLQSSMQTINLLSQLLPHFCRG